MVLPIAARNSIVCRASLQRRLAPSICRQCRYNRAFSQNHKLLKATTTDQHARTNARKGQILGDWDKYSYTDSVSQPTATTPRSRHVGFIGKRRNVSKHLSFADLTLPTGEIIQLCSNAEIDSNAHSQFRSVQAHAPVSVDIHDDPPAASNEDANANASKRTVYVKDIRPLNNVPHDLIVTPDSQFPSNKRHLQIRFHPELQARLKFRSWLKGNLNQSLLEKGFTDIETPTLFKSTPEGAREFLVPTRQKGTAYALSQSPQQYKQALMASGIMRYMQWARCYRDEDLRADRQPEFSQLDMEWAFADATTVQEDINDIVLHALKTMEPAQTYTNVRGEYVPLMSKLSLSGTGKSPEEAHQFMTLTFREAIEKYGSDKPDLRIPGRIHSIPNLEPYRQFVSMITHMDDPQIEAFTLPLEDRSIEEIRRFLIEFMDNLPPELGQNPDGKPQVLMFDSSKPLCGLSSLGHDYEKVVDLLSEGKELQDGDLLVFQARPKLKGQFCQGSTRLGDLRRDLWKGLVEQGYMEKPQMGTPGSLQFVWVTEFPMFKPVEEGEPGQGGAAGISACHHPFTAPLSRDDLELLFTEPLEAKSAAYDLVLNGVEIGGGSVRNHLVEVQEFIMHDVLKMSKERMKDFSHLFEILRSSCPPHAGFALGFDRLVALLSGTPTVRDVIAFPKTMKGEDLFVKSPSKITNEQLKPYGLQHIPKNK